MEEKFIVIKEEILRRGREASACEEINRAVDSESMVELAQVIKDNFEWCVCKQVLDTKLIGEYREEFARVGIYVNESRSDGYVVVNKEIDHLKGNATAILCDNATVNRVYDNATVNRVYDNATVNEVFGNATVNRVYDNATVSEVYDNATVNRVYDNATVKYVYDNATVSEVYGNAYISVYSYIECKISEHAIMRVRSENKIYTNTEAVKPK